MSRTPIPEGHVINAIPVCASMSDLESTVDDESKLADLKAMSGVSVQTSPVEND